MSHPFTIENNGGGKLLLPERGERVGAPGVIVFY